MDFIGGVLIGVLVATVTQVVSRVFTEPILDLRELRGDVADSLIYYTNAYGPLASEERKKEAQAKLRSHASRLRAKTHTVVLYRVWSVLGLLPKRKDVLEASRSLIGLSNYVRETDPNEAGQAYKIEKKIRGLLLIVDDPQPTDSGS